MNYQDYINSALWRTNEARLAELAASGFRCRICNAGRDIAQLEVHHRTYERLGYEEVGDLTTLCSQCHHAATDDLRRRRYAGRAWTTSDHQPCSENFRGFGELLLKGGRP